MKRKSIILVIVVMLGLVCSLGCSESEDSANTSGNAEDIQTGEVQAAQEEPVPTTTEAVVTKTPVVTETEKSKTVNLEDVKETEEETPKEDIEARMRQIEEEDKDEESTAPTASSDDLVWLNVMSTDIKIVESDMSDVASAATSNDIRSLSIYSDNLYTSTQTAIDHCDKYDVSADLQPVEDEYRLGMVAFNWAAVYCYAGVESYNAGNPTEASASFNDATKYINSGSEHITRAIELLNEYNENHGV